MTGVTTSLADTYPLANSARAEWRGWMAFLRRPQLPDGLAPAASGVRGTARMLGLDILVMAVLMGALGAAIGLGFELPNNAFNDLEFDVGLIALTVLFAPLMEEIFFRSWLSGRPGHVLGVIVRILSTIAAGYFGQAHTGEEAMTWVAGALASGVILALLVVFFLRKRPTMRWFRSLFPGFFWLSTIGFALIHLANYTEGTIAILLPLVIPQFILGTMCAYVRVHYGLWSAVALHMLHNGLIVSLVLAGAEFAA